MHTQKLNKIQINFSRVSQANYESLPVFSGVADFAFLAGTGVFSADSLGLFLALSTFKKNY